MKRPHKARLTARKNISNIVYNNKRSDYKYKTLFLWHKNVFYVMRKLKRNMEN